MMKRERSFLDKCMRLAAWPCFALLPCLLLLACSTVQASDLTLPGVSPEVLSPLQALRIPVRIESPVDSEVDWGNRVLVARGRGLQQGDGGQSELMAKAAAKDFAIRNAVALAGGIRIGIDGSFRQFRSGSLYLDALVKGAEAKRYENIEEYGQTWWIAEVHVPLLGIKGLSGQVVKEARRSHRRVGKGLRRLHRDSAYFPDPPEDSVLLIDARGLGLTPSLYPILVGADDQLVLDADSVSEQNLVERGLCGFVTTELDADDLERGQAVASLAPIRQAFPQPPVRTDMPLNIGADWLPKRILVKGEKAVGPERSFLRLSDQATQRLKQDHRAASLLYGGKVMVIVDAASTGQEGSLPGDTIYVRAGSPR